MEFQPAEGEDETKYAIVNVQSGRYLDADTNHIQEDSTAVHLVGTTAEQLPNRQWRIERVKK
jgi:hypothetical protein